MEPAFIPAYLNLADLYREMGREDEGEAGAAGGAESGPPIGFGATRPGPAAGPDRAT